MRLRDRPIADWPPLAWLARCRPGETTIDVFHGRRVEIAADWLCEAAWNGSFADGDFDRTDLVFGSGVRVRGDRVCFVSSGSTVDRLQSLDTRDASWVSNSLPCLLASVGGTLDPTYAGYFPDLKSISRGLTRYARVLATENMGAPSRVEPYRMLGTISSGYDSAAAAALARPYGLTEAISFGSASSGEPDSGEIIADVLGVRLTILAPRAWRAASFAEVPFVAADAKGEDVCFKGAEEGGHLAGRVLLTGFHGDRVWDRAARTDADLVRGDQSGLSLSEYRLWAGFLHCPLPFAGARQAASIRAISRSRELAPWHTGAYYSRPICRRILEEAGVPRDAFGRWKKSVSVLFSAQEGFLTPASLADYRFWLERHAEEWRRRGLTPPSLVADSEERWRGARDAIARVLEGLAHAGPRRLWFLRSAARRIITVGRRDRLFHHLFPWAMERAKQRYVTAPLDEPSPRAPEPAAVEASPVAARAYG
ncbi:MAG: hypothetical protein DMD61_14120 [Gemmatimonadetes bacterium]|nr:MAG: hypothetical protein DMD61_14120 [Gemmatimonadota bacterium]